jgi:hypothetical protein
MFTSSGTFAQSSRIPADLGEKLWKKSFDASHAVNLSTLRISGYYTLKTGSMRLGDFSVSYEEPDSDLMVYETAGHGISKIGRHNGKTWIKTSVSPDGMSAVMLNDVSVPLLANVWRSFYEADWHRSYSKIEALGKGKIKGREVYVIRLTTKSGDPENRYLDAQSFLAVRSDHLQRFRPRGDKQEKAFTVSFYYDDYRETDGVKIPHHIEAVGDPEPLEFELSSVQVNAPAQSSLFDDPNRVGK